MKNKILIFTVVFVVLVSLFAIPCFAAETVSFSAGDSFEFAETLNLNMFPTGVTQISHPFVCADVSYYGFYISYRGYYVLSYIGSSDGEYQDVYIDGEGWVDDEYRTITFSADASFEGEWSDFIISNENEHVFSVYGTIFSLISDRLFVGFMEDDFVKLSVTFLAVLLTMGVFITPFAICYAVFKMIITAIDRIL